MSGFHLSSNKSPSALSWNPHLSGNKKEIATQINAVPINNKPNPYQFQILRKYVYKSYVLIMVRYPDCKNYEGKKILLFSNNTGSYGGILYKDFLDPHFFEDYPLIARFLPTQEGWELGLNFIKGLK